MIQQEIIDLGLMDYEEAYALQKKSVQEVIEGGRERIFLCEHPPVLTLGRVADKRHILAPSEELNRQGIKVVSIDRGGEVTLHAPGQLVVYPILNLARRGRDLRRYLYDLEELIILFLSSCAIEAGRIPGKTGVWVGPQKIASIGVGVKKWVSFHGFAVNVSMDLDLFSCINPCGMKIRMTSMEETLGIPVLVSSVKSRMAGNLLKKFIFE